MTKMIFVVNGFPRTGKDTLIANVSKLLEDTGLWCCENISSIKPVWDWLSEMGAPMHEKTPAQRACAAAIKTEVEKLDWLATRQTMKMALDEVSETHRLGINGIAFLHMREPAAIQFAKSICPADTIFKTVLLHREGVVANFNNPADQDVEKMEYDFVLNNHGDLDQFKATAIVLANFIIDLTRD